MGDLRSDRWTNIGRIYEGARGLPPDAREAFLADACAGDSAIRAEVESLLTYDTAARAFLTQPAIDQVRRSLTPLLPGALAGRQIHGYLLQSLLGVGGMGDVYLARDLRLGRDVALKILSAAMATDAGYLRRFEAEARSASVLNHPNIVTIYGVGEEGDVHYIAMERVHGRTLREVAAPGDLTIPGVLDLAVQLADALAVAHDNGIVHRDLKPDNVMVTPDGLLKVLDFGIAKREGVPDAPPGARHTTEVIEDATQAGTILGTLGYMSPEQANGRRAGPQSDQFSFGVILYELLTGHRAFERGDRSSTLDAIRHDEPKAIQTINPNVVLPLRQLVARCLAKDPADRFASSRDLSAELRGIRERVTGRGGLSRRQVLWMAGTASAVTATAAVAGWWYWPRGPRVNSCALLPFENVGGDPDMDALIAGLNGSLIDRIDELSIRVMPQTLVSNFKRSGLDARAFARQVGADSVLTGTIERRGSELMINASLVETASGKSLWSNPYTLPAADLQAIRDAIASKIVTDGIQLRLSPNERTRLTRPATQNAEAFTLVLRAAYLNEDDGADVNRQRIEWLKRAIALDSMYALAYAELAQSYMADAVCGYRLPAECWPAAKANIREAIDHDRNLAEGYSAKAGYHFWKERDFDAAEAAWGQFQRSARSSQTTQRAPRSLQQMLLGKKDVALHLIQELRQLDTLSFRFIDREATYLRYAGKLDDSAAAFEKALLAYRDSPALDAQSASQRQMLLDGLYLTMRAQGRFADAIENRRQMYELVDPRLDRVLASARGAEGCRQIEQTMAQIKLAQLAEDSAKGIYVAPIDRARQYAQCGETARAFAALGEAFDVDDPGVLFLKVDPQWDELRADPRFKAALQRAGLPT